MKYKNALFLTLALIAAIFSGYAEIPFLHTAAKMVSQVFVNLLKLVSLPLIFFSIISTVSGMEEYQEVKLLGMRVARYTLLTTVLAASIALLLFLVMDPASVSMTPAQISAEQSDIAHTKYMDYLVHLIPSNILQPFVEGNAISVLFLALLFSLAILKLPPIPRKTLHEVFSAIYATITQVTRWIVVLIPFAIWAFATLFIREMKGGVEIEGLFIYLACVVLANLVQAFIVLPLLLKYKGISPLKIAKGMLPALSVAFFTKSSSGTLPMTMRCAEQNCGVSRKVSNFTLPLCTTINMNGCAAFILITVLFVAMSHGVHFNMAELVLWIGLSTLAAIGNAGVPMGCYFLASALLATMNVPLYIMGVILPFYTLIDMVETALNVWSDASIAVIVEKESP